MFDQYPRPTARDKMAKNILRENTGHLEILSKYRELRMLKL